MTKTFFALGTVNKISISYREADEGKVMQAADLVKQMTESMDDRLSVFKAASEMSALNAQAGRGDVRISPDTLKILQASKEWSEITEGAFDITTQPLTKLWSIGESSRIPSPHEIRKAKKLIGYEDLVISGAGNGNGFGTAGLRRKGQSVDLGAIAKGHAADLAHDILSEHGIDEAIINFGGTVIISGRPKSIGIQDPGAPVGTPMGSITASNTAVVTSGSYEKYFIKDGRRYHHLIDPRTGEPAESGLASVTLIGPSAMELDALTTAVFVLGIQKGFSLVRERGLEGVFITDQGDVFLTDGIRGRFSFSDGRRVTDIRKQPQTAGA
jgi:thiamine biosynthesis lipoprotein